jgi:hypothetical protein
LCSTLGKPCPRVKQDKPLTTRKHHPGCPGSGDRSLFIRSNLFSRGHPLKAEAGLSDVLNARKRGVLNKIKGITALDQMTDSFCEGIIRGALVEPLVLHFDRMTRQTRTEEIDGSSFPGDFFVERGRRYPKTVVRILVPFSGERDLLQYSPSTAGLTFPRGEVSGNTIQFDILMWGYTDDANRVKQELDSNRSLLETCATRVSEQVKQFNAALAPQIRAEFAAKLEELTKQHGILDDLGIPEEPEPPALPNSPVTPKVKKGKARSDQIIVNIERIEQMIVQTLNQTNNNTGDVNNAIQGS